MKTRHQLPLTRILPIALTVLSLSFVSCSRKSDDLTASEILGNPDYLAFSYGGYRGKTRNEVPSVEMIKEDLRILSALGVKLLRTYNTQQFEQARHLLQAIRELKTEQSKFEMHVMLGAWIECEGAWTATPNHQVGNVENNQAEIQAAVELAQTYPEIVKIIAVGNEAMVHWASGYFVVPSVIHHWVDYLQGLKATGELPSTLWVTSSDNYESWGGGSADYHTDELSALINAVDFISLHTYPFHDSYHRSDFWAGPESEAGLSIVERAAASIERAMQHSKSQYIQTLKYLERIKIAKPIHIGETGWASIDNTHFGSTESRAADEYKSKLFYDAMRAWTREEKMSCFYFEAFDEQWKDRKNSLGSENHFGLITLEGLAKYPLWNAVDKGAFRGLTRNGSPIAKTFGGDEAKLKANILPPPNKKTIKAHATSLSFSGRGIFLNDEPFFSRGICYQPTPIGEDASKEEPYGDYFTREYSPLYQRDIPKMREMGANVVRLYGWDSTKDHTHFLDTLYNEGDKPIRAILNLWIDPETNWKDPESIQTITTQFLDMATNVGHHPAILGFLIGNETNGHHGNGDQPAFWEAINHVAKALKAQSPDRLISVAITDALHQVKRFDATLSHIDAWSIQVYRGLNFGDFYNEYAATSSKPLLVTEFGLDAYDGNAESPYPQNGKFVADIVGAMINEMESRRDICSGGCIFEYGDEWWKSKGSPSEQDAGGIPNGGYPDKLLNEEWWGIFEVSDQGTEIDQIRPRQLFYTLKELWAEPK